MKNRKQANANGFFDKLPIAFALHKIIINKKREPVDYEFLEVNRAFEKFTGLKKKDIVGKRVTQIIPGIEKDKADWIGKYGAVALSGRELNFDSKSEPLKKYYRVKAFSPEWGYFITLFEDITEYENEKLELLKLKAEAEMAGRVNGLRAELWGMAVESRADEVKFIEKALKITGPVIGVDRLNYSRIQGREVMCLASWSMKGVRNALRTRFPAELLKYFTHNKPVEVDRESIINTLPLTAKKLFGGLLNIIVRSLGVERILVYPIFSGKTLGGILTADITTRKGGKKSFSVHDKQILVELSTIISTYATRKSINDEITRSEEKFKSLFENAPDTYYIMDMDGNFIDGNKSAEKLLGRKKEEFIGKNFAKAGILDKQYLPAAMKHLGLNRMGKPGGPEEFEVYGAGGKIRIEVTTIPINIDNRKVILGIARDLRFRKEAEERLKISDEILKLTADSVFLTDLDENVVFANRAACDDLGYSKHELEGLKLYKLEDPPDNEKVKRRMVEIVRKDSMIFETARMTKKGMRIRYEENARLVRLGDKVFVLSVCRNIEERKKAEEERVRLFMAVEQSPSSIVITDIAGNIEFVNPKFTSVTGYSMQDVAGKNPRVLKSGETTSEDYRVLWATISSGQEWRGEFHNKKKDGTFFWESASISPVKNSRGEIISYIAVKEDITEQKKLREEASRNAEALRDFLENANDMIQMVDTEGSFIYVNRSWKNTLGYSDEEISGMTVFDVIAPEKYQLCVELFKKVMEGKCGDFVETIFVAKDGKRVQVEGNVNCHIENGKPVSTRAIFRNVTDKRIAEKQLKESYEKLKELDSMKTNFVSMVSHELRTPLTSIKGFLSLISAGAAGSVNPLQKEYLEIIHDNSERLLTLINDLLDMSKIESGTFVIEKHSKDLAEVIAVAVRGLVPLAEKKKVELTFAPGAGDIIADIDAYRITQVIINLVNNALKFTRENTVIGITLEKIKSMTLPVPDYATLPETATMNWALISVKDQGRGIEPEFLPKLFNRFYQVKAEDNKIFKGVGLGLNISKSIVQAHGGTAWAESEGRGKGATFKVLLPLR